jgi:ribosome-associated protein
MVRAPPGTFNGTIAVEYHLSGGHPDQSPENRVIMQAEQLKDLVVTALEDIKAQDVSVIDVRDRTSVTDFMVLASGTSSRHVKSLADSVVSEAKDQGVRANNVEGDGGSDWILVDLGDVVVHVMMPATREFYDLERFWRDAPDLGAAGHE